MNLPPLPQCDFPIDVGLEEVARFREDGYLAIERITTDEELEWLRGVYDALFAAGHSFDTARPYGEVGGEPRLSQIIQPEARVPELRNTVYFRNARRVIARLLGQEERDLVAWGHMILKHAHRGPATPWHQDEAYWDPELEYCAVGAWLPLDDVGPHNGCLRFVPGSHRQGVLPHHHQGGNPAVHLLELDDFDASQAVSVPLRAGGASFHHQRTVHGAWPNPTSEARRAYANEFQKPPVPRAEPVHRPWIDEMRQALADLGHRRAEA
jgi:hypothetical protein